MHWSVPEVHGDIPTQGLRSHSSVLVGSKIFVFGGSDLSSEFNHLLVFDTETMYWYKPTPSGTVPGPHRAHSATLVDNNRMIVFGGGDGPNYFDTLYILDTNNMHWTKPDIKGKCPGPRRAHTAVLFGPKKLFVFGGGDGNKALNETFILDTEKLTWEPLKVTGELPSPRGYHASMLVGDKMYVYGGSDGQECFSDIFVLDPASAFWSKKKVSNQLPCFSQSTTAVGSWLYAFGGHDSASYTNELRLLNLDSRKDSLEWIKKPCSGTPPSPRGYQTALLYDSRIFVFGGYDGKRCYGDTHVLDLGIYSI